MTNRLTQELRRLAKLLSAASASVDVIAEELEAGPARAPPPSAPTFVTVDEPAEPAAPPWDAMVERAIELLRSDPKRTWKPAELTRAVRDSGIALSSLQGAHFGLVSRLRQLGAIEDGDTGLHASALAAA